MDGSPASPRMAVFGRIHLDAHGWLGKHYPQLDPTCVLMHYPDDPNVPDVDYTAVALLAYDIHQATKAAPMLGRLLSRPTGASPAGIVVRAQWYRRGIASPDSAYHGNIRGKRGMIALASLLDGQPDDAAVYVPPTPEGTMKAAALICQLSVNPQDEEAQRTLTRQYGLGRFNGW